MFGVQGALAMFIDLSCGSRLRRVSSASGAILLISCEVRNHQRNE